MKLIRLFALAFLLSSCGAGYHLRQAQKHLQIAIDKGAKVKADTIFKEIPVPVVRVDTVVQNITEEKLLRDTITVTQNNEVIKIKYIPQEKKVYVNITSTKPKFIKVPVIVNKTISAGYSKWDMAIGFIILFMIGFTIGFLFRMFSKG